MVSDSPEKHKVETHQRPEANKEMVSRRPHSLDPGPVMPSPPINCSPVAKVENDEQHWKHTEKNQICPRESVRPVNGAVNPFLSAASTPAVLYWSIMELFPTDFLEFQFEQNDCVLKQSTKHKNNAGYHPALYRSQALSL